MQQIRVEALRVCPRSTPLEAGWYQVWSVVHLLVDSCCPTDGLTWAVQYPRSAGLVIEPHRGQTARLNAELNHAAGVDLDSPLALSLACWSRIQDDVTHLEKVSILHGQAYG